MKESPALTKPVRPGVPAATATAVEAAERHELVSQFVAAGELERRRLAESIHDDSIQVIAAMGMRLQMLRRAIDDPEQLDMLADAEQLVQFSIERLRALVFELHPPGLAQEGLSTALAIALDVAAAGDAAPRYRLDDQLVSQPPADAGIILFRISQEALANVREHAQASSVVVTLRELDGGYAVRVADDGCGCEPGFAAGAVGPGFASMRARAALAGGSVRVDSSPGRGTAVEAWLPESPWLGQAGVSA